jgi:hypothetical protein
LLTTPPLFQENREVGSWEAVKTCPHSREQRAGSRKTKDAEDKFNSKVLEEESQGVVFAPEQILH